MSFDEAAHNYLISSDHKEGFDLDYCKDFFRDFNFNFLLDIATGAGHFLKVFNVKNKIATDISFNMLKMVKSNDDNIFCVQNSYENLAFKNSFFDIVTCRIALHHFKKPSKFFEEVYRVLKNNGFFVLIDSIVDIEDAYLNVIEFIRDNTHFRSYTFKEIVEFINGKFRLLNYQLQFKKHDFKEWATRLNDDEDYFNKIKEAFLSLPENIKDALALEINQGEILSYTDKKGIFIFQKL
ncbi:class I SAM-dependent methyltransferase [Deferribacter thermophilus]|uniref:class I SAM-dependent methyltransferase n=1 Tax=Deferribacter thermophilus TaxID=53573 RepID=UPI003C232A91